MENNGYCTLCCGMGIITQIMNFQENALACKQHLVQKDFKKLVNGKMATVTYKVPYFSGLAFYQDLYEYNKTQFPWEKSVFLDYQHCYGAYKTALYYFGYWRQTQFRDPLEYLDDFLNRVGITHEKMIKQILEMNPKKNRECLKKADYK